jgi:hypothetical protein
MLRLWRGFAVSAFWRATVLRCDSEWLHTAHLTLVAVKEYGWDVLPMLPGAQTLPCQTATCLALEISHIVLAIREWNDSQGSYVSVFVECSNGLSQWHIRACTVLHKCVLCNADCAEKWQKSSGTEDCTYTSVVVWYKFMFFTFSMAHVQRI